MAPIRKGGELPEVKDTGLKRWWSPKSFLREALWLPADSASNLHILVLYSVYFKSCTSFPPVFLVASRLKHSARDTALKENGHAKEGTRVEQLTQNAWH